MTWARVSSVGIALACALVIIAHAPAVLVEPLQTAVAQVRWNAYTTEKAEATAILSSEEIPTGEAATSARKKTFK